MNRPRTLLVFAGLALLLLGVSACGGEAEPEAPDAAEEQAAAVESAPAEDAAKEQTAAVESTPAEDAAKPAVPEPPEAPVSGRTGGEKLAPDLVQISSWINSEPLTIQSQRGRVVLIDFWTYTCINCIRTFPYLRDWQEKYADRGLVIIGVHTPEFEFEKDRDNVVAAAAKHGLEYPIAQDNDFGTWDAFSNRAWPAKYLIDADGYIRYTHFGEGDYVETEQKIRDLLVEAGVSVDDITLNYDQGPEIAPRARIAPPAEGQTRELYAGVERNYGALRSGAVPPYVLHEDYYKEFPVDALYEDPGNHLNHFLYLHGLWRNNLESLSHARETEDFGDYIAIKFNATEVNVVMSPEDGQPYEVRVTLDGRPLVPSEAGASVMFDGGGNSFIQIDRSEMYRVFSVPDFRGHELKLSSNSADFHVFAFTFGSYMNEPVTQGSGKS